MTPEELEAKRRSRALERRMSMENDVEEQKIKLLLLGAGESGKSTIFKQMRIMYGDKMGEKELNAFRAQVWRPPAPRPSLHLTAPCTRLGGNR